ncbi:MAG: hopanoid biosynthesis-associated RND transporter HpnN [Alphaproteobacteria bacterium]|nr:MAG: hopanoid biosynthesis-associated RND transporter HpnN [Alphaproteobacteria bacterium]
MLRSSIVRLVELCTRHAWPVIVLAIALAAFCTLYTARHFAVATDIKQLFPTELPWTQRAYDFIGTFPQHDVLVIVDAPTAESADRAAAKLTAALSADTAHFKAVQQPQGGAFFARNGLLFLPSDELRRMAGEMSGAGPLIGALAADPSLRGALGALAQGLMGVANGAYGLDALTRPMQMAGDTVDAALHNRPAHFSWRELASGRAAKPEELRRFIEIEPVLDFNALQPGLAATQAITDAAQRLNLAGGDQARVRVTGLVPMNDAEFATLQDHAAVNGAVSIAAVLIILWLALRSSRIILAAIISIACGLAYSAALGLFLVGALNLISVAFFVLFVGLGIDFGIQFSVRYRAERYDIGALEPALISAARKAGAPLALAAAATALGFVAFLPTEYRGLGELGEIAGPGMLIAFLTSITLLPALLRVLNPPGELRPMGFAGLAPIDRFLQRQRVAVVGVTLAVVILASPLLAFLPFDFNPLHLQNPNSEAVATYLELRRDPQTGANAAEIIKPDLAAAEASAQRLSRLPDVAQTRTLANFVPADQQQKLASIRQIAAAIGPALRPNRTLAPPSDADTIAALLSTAGSLSQFAALGGAGGDAAKRLAQLLTQLAQADAASRQRVAAAVVAPLTQSLGGLRAALDPEPVTAATIPPEIKRDWIAPDGRARVQVLPSGDPENTAVLRQFVTAVLAAEPDASGPAVMLYEAGNTIVRAFIEAGIFALGAIALLLWITLRRVTDVLMTLVPLLLAAVVTLELCVVFDLPLNFANIIALPLLLGVGVAFKIYYIMAWRRGRTALVQSTLTRAVIFSAMTTATAFGSLWLSRHPGTSSMGQLMALALLCTMMAAVQFQPALMGPPREVARDEPLPAPAEPEAVPAMASWAVERVGTRETARAVRVGTPNQEEHEKQDAVHEVED